MKSASQQFVKANMPFPIGPDLRLNQSENDFTVCDPFGLRLAITPVFAVDLREGDLRRDPRNGEPVGLGTSFYVTPFGQQLSAMHVVAEFLNTEGIDPVSTNTPCKLKRNALAILQDPGVVLGGARPAGNVLYLDKLTMFPVDQTKHPLRDNFTREQLRYVEPSLDLASWKVCDPADRKTMFLPVRVGCPSNIKIGDRVMAIGYPKIKGERRSGAKMVSYEEELRASIGRVIEVSGEWDQDRKIWPTLTVDSRWEPGMSGGPVFNENWDVVGIVSKGFNFLGECSGRSSALWLEPLPFSRVIFGDIDHKRPGWVYGWGVCNPHSLIELFQTRQDAEAFAQENGAELTIAYVSTPYLSHNFAAFAHRTSIGHS